MSQEGKAQVAALMAAHEQMAQARTPGQLAAAQSKASAAVEAGRAAAEKSGRGQG